MLKNGMKKSSKRAWALPLALLPALGLLAADYTQNGTVNAEDAAAILRRAAGME